MKFVQTILGAAVAAASPLAGAATFTVTNLNDSGAGSLRDAIQQANASAGADTVRFGSALTGTIALSSEILVSDTLNLAGPGAGRITVDGNLATRLFKVAHASGSAITATFSGLTLANGHAPDEGGAIWATGDHVVVSGCIFDGNIANTRGGAIFTASANLTIDGSGIWNSETGSTGGAILFSAGDLVITRSLIADNASEFGGGLSALSPRVNVTISDTTFRNNSADHTGGGIWASTATSFKVSRSAFVENRTGQPNGGGIYFAGVTDFGSPTNIIENTTFSGNESLHQVGRGSALAVASGNMTIRNSTFAFNKTSAGMAGGADAGGALWVAGGDTTEVKLQSDLFAGNTHGSENVLIDVYRVNGGSQSTIDVSNSAFQTQPSVGTLNGSVTNTMFDTDPLLEPLDENAFTPYHALPQTSPVVDHGANPGNLATDQRGAPRASASTEGGQAVTDIGAYEYRTDRIFFGDFEAH
ncbi:MAG TPA: right-handed parallel beta-helix repeat-containing protein [Rhodanobacteraceae bacterium]|nr:right-handed parallel beta-helix repeat-containing protein [Rhodanobacteraceae bacterium]